MEEGSPENEGNKRRPKAKPYRKGGKKIPKLEESNNTTKNKENKNSKIIIIITNLLMAYYIIPGTTLFNEHVI